MAECSGRYTVMIIDDISGWLCCFDLAAQGDWAGRCESDIIGTGKLQPSHLSVFIAPMFIYLPPANHDTDSMIHDCNSSGIKRFTDRVKMSKFWLILRRFLCKFSA
jgi:hypothetical protein